MSRSRTVALLAGSLLIATAALAAPPSPPVAAKQPVKDTYWGVEVIDDYQYLEAVEDQEVMRWANGQNAYTRDWLDGRPERALILDRVVALTHAESPRFYGLTERGGLLFARKRQPPKEQAFLVVFPPGGSLSGERPLVDPNTIDPTGSTSIDFYVPSLDGILVAVSLSEKGTEQGTLHIYEVATGRKLGDVIPRVNGGTAGGSVAWTADGSGLYYTRYPYPGERPDEDLFFYQQVYYHKLGTPIAKDTYALGEQFTRPRLAEIQLQSSLDGRYILAEASDGDGGEYAYWLKGPDDRWRLVADYEDKVIDAKIGADRAIYLLSRANAPRKKILRLPLATPELSRATVVVPQTEAVIRSYLPTATRLYVVEMLGGPSRLHVYDHGGRSLGVVAMDEISTISGLVRLEGDEILLSRQSYTTPPAYYRYGPQVSGL